jgi:hypothetical protein
MLLTLAFDGFTCLPNIHFATLTGNAIYPRDFQA